MAEIAAIRCMQLPLVNMQLLLPNSSVAEIIGYVHPETGGGEKDWYYGLIAWRGVMVPVISVEQLCEQESVEPGARSRIAIVYHPEGDERVPYLGIVLQDIPRAYLAEQDRMMDVLTDAPCRFLAGRADMMIEQLLIPDIDAIMDEVRQRLNPN
jgi:chemosensory pili system protein ChpC